MTQRSVVRTMDHTNFIYMRNVYEQLLEFVCKRLLYFFENSNKHESSPYILQDSSKEMMSIIWCFEQMKRALLLLFFFCFESLSLSLSLPLRGLLKSF